MEVLIYTLLNYYLNYNHHCLMYLKLDYRGDGIVNKVRKRNTISFKERVLSYQAWFLIVGLLSFLIFAAFEHVQLKNQPSEEWSTAISIVKDAPNDYRKIGTAERYDGEGIVLAYVVEEGVKLHELDWFGKIQRSLLVELDTSKIMVLNIGVEDGFYYVFHSDRKTLDRIDIDTETLTVKDQKRISNTSEQFAVVGNTVFVGDDDIAEIIVDERVVATFDGYDDIKRVFITEEEGKIFAGLNTVNGGDLIVVDGDSVNRKNIMTKNSQSYYGFFKDIYVDAGVITVASSYYSLNEPNPTAMGVWQLREDSLADINFQIFYHVQTPADPIITNVDGNRISYIFAAPQTLDHINKGVSRYPQAKGGMFTNISHYTREDDILRVNTRLSVTREFPIGYNYFQVGDGEVLIWADRVGSKANIQLTGKGKDWISYANKVYTVDFQQAVSSSLITFGSMVFMGPLTFILKVGLHIKYILIFAALAFIYGKWVPLDEEKKSMHLFYAGIIFVIVFKLFITAVENDDLRYYGHIYPMILGNNFVLAAISLITSAVSLAALWFFIKENDHIRSKSAHLSFFIGFETFIYMCTILVYLVSSMAKINFMV